jgi:hypothetical protein
MELEQFDEAVRKDDFAVGDSFWLGDWEFEVVNRRNRGKPAEEEVVFRWELTRQEFVRVIAGNHPEIHDPKAFFERHGDDIMHRFRRGFDTLVGECGATYETVMNDTIATAVRQEQAKESASCTGIIRGEEK